ncbi:RNA polymerase [Carbonactinospora thermoautotrophica]|uniref:RNA polymerase n=1 Tax=Carbonactinospora thermoautotrophica TaxID=1469144 RepID=A0A132MKY0_9ACTN|nr:RNA polymerase [Carbonactinospora thermoautotrophica]
MAPGPTEAGSSGRAPEPTPAEDAPAPLAELADGELLARHVDGDREAFAQLVRRHRDRLWAVALRTLGDPEDAADALQDALVSAYRKADRFRGESAVTTWLYRIVVNACLDLARRRAVRSTQALDAETAERLPAADGAPDAIERQELRLDLVSALDTLSVEQRAALVLVDMQGYSVVEAAEILGVPPGTVKSRCARGRAKLLPLVRNLREAGNRPGAGNVPVADRDNPRGVEGGGSGP